MSAPVLYEGYEVCVIAPDALEGGSRDVAHARERLDAPAGTWAQATVAGTTGAVQAVQWSATSREGIADLEDFLARRRGRFTAFWMPSYLPDFTMRTLLYPSEFIAEPSGYAATLFAYPHLRWLGLVDPLRPNGIAIAPIQNAVVQPDRSEKITMNGLYWHPDPPWQLYQQRETLLSLVRLVRLAEDQIEYRYRSPRVLEVTAHVVDLVAG